MSRSRNVKIFVIVGYVSMAALCIVGIVLIFSEWMNNSKQSEPYEKRTELIELSNTFAAMYQAESASGFTSILTDDRMKAEYDSLMNSVFIQIDSISGKRENSDIKEQLDSLHSLLQLKQTNTQELELLIRTYNEDKIFSTTRTTIKSNKNLDALDDIFENLIQMENYQDTATVVQEKKGIFKRIGDAIKNNQPDTIQQINMRSVSNIREFVIPEMKDTIVQILEDVTRRAQRENARLFASLSQKQGELYSINEQTSAQINSILTTLNLKEEFISQRLNEYRTNTIRSSARIISIIAVTAFLLSLLFITKIIQLVTRQEKQQKEIEDLLLVREQLMLTISHDIKAPINSIMGYLELIKDKLSETSVNYVKNMQKSAKHILDLIQKLLDFHVLEAKEQKVDMISFSLYSFLRDVYDSFVPIAQDKNIRFESDLAINPNINCKTDSFRLRQIIDNILSNAIKFTPKNGNVIFSASFEEAKNKTNLKISIKDSGLGIKDEDKEKIFSSFNRLSYNSSSIEGSGLGLSITRKLTELLGGTITVDSKYGKGSTFIVTIPVTEIKKIEKKKIENSTSTKENLRVLFIDDDPIQLNLFSEFMKKEKIFARTTSSYEEIFDLLQKEKFDIIFTDIQMGNVDGFTLMKQIRKSDFPNAKTIPIVAITGKENVSVSEYLQSGFSNFLSKPFTSSQLTALITGFTTPTKKEKKEYTAPTKGFQALLEFAGEDKEAEQKIMESFIQETEKNYKSLKKQFEENNTKEAQRIAHKMVPIMRIISENSIADLLHSYEKGTSKEGDKTLLLELISEKLQDAKTFYQSTMNRK